MSIDGRPSLVRLAPWWMAPAALFLIAVPVAEAITGPIAPDSTANALLYGARLLIEGGAFVWAAGARQLHPRVRFVLRTLGLISLAAGLMDWVGEAARAAGITLPQGLLIAVTLGSYVFSLVQVGLPLQAPRRGERTVFALDMLVGVGGLSALLWTLVTRPAGVVEAGGPSALVMTYAVGQMAQLAGPLVLVTRGLGYPSPRALWLFTAGQSAYVPVLLMAQGYEQGFLTDTLAIDALYFGSVLFTLAAAVAYRRDAPAESPRPLVTAYSLVNPFVLGVPLVVAASLLVALHAGRSMVVLPIAWLLAVLSVLVALRTWRAEQERARLLEAEAGEAARLAASKNAALGRLAGGIAHEFNNLMQVVIGHADLASAGMPTRSTLGTDLLRIRTAAERAALLTSQLLHFSGRQMQRQHVIALPDVIDAVRTGTTLPADVRVTVSLEAAPPVHADPTQMRMLVTELVSNAADAMPRGGELQVRVRMTDVDGPVPGAVLQVAPGRYVELDVDDTGAGVPPERVVEMFEPFFSTKPGPGRAGLGLAAVYGIVASHGGGIAVEARTGGGTRVRVFLPCDTAEPVAAAAS